MYYGNSWCVRFLFYVSQLLRMCWCLWCFFLCPAGGGRRGLSWSSPPCSPPSISFTFATIIIIITFFSFFFFNIPFSHDFFSHWLVGEIGSASCRERVYISVVAVSLKKKQSAFATCVLPDHYSFHPYTRNSLCPYSTLVFHLPLPVRRYAYLFNTILE